VAAAAVTGTNRGAVQRAEKLKKLAAEVGQPEVAEQVVAGVLSAHAAAVQAGFRRATWSAPADPQRLARGACAIFRTAGRRPYGYPIFNKPRLSGGALLTAIDTRARAGRASRIYSRSTHTYPFTYADVPVESSASKGQPPTGTAT